MNRPTVIVTDGDLSVPMTGPTVDIRTLRDDIFELDAVTVSATVSDDASATAVLRAVQRGATVTLQIRLTEPSRSEFIDQLRRVADVQTDAGPTLSIEQRALLDHLRRGASMTETAHALHLSRRTVDRRLAEIKRILNVVTTTEALRFCEPT